LGHSLIQTFLQAHSEVTHYDTPVPAAGVAAGDRLIFSFLISGTTNEISSMTDDKGNSYVIHQTLHASGVTLSIQVGSAYIGTALVNGDEIHTDLTGGTGGSIFFCDYAGLAINAFDKASNHQTTFDTTYSSNATATTTSANELLYGSHGSRSLTNPFTPTGSFTTLTQFDNGTSCLQQIQTRDVTATGSYTSAGTLSTDGTTLNVICTFADAPPAAATGVDAVVARYGGTGRW